MNLMRTGAFWRTTFAFLAMPALFALAACGDDPIQPQDPTTVTFAPELGVDLAQMERRQGGVYVRTLTPGTGDSITTGEVTLAYEVWLADGTEIAADTFDMNFDVNQVIPGFYIGAFGVRVDELRQIVIPPELAYGSAGVPDAGIPGGAVLVYEIEALEVPADTTDTTTTVTADRLQPGISLF